MTGWPRRASRRSLTAYPAVKTELAGRLGHHPRAVVSIVVLLCLLLGACSPTSPSSTAFWTPGSISETPSAPASGKVPPDATGVSRPGSQAPATSGLQAAEQTLRTLQDAAVPTNDPLELASALQGLSAVPSLLPDSQAPFKLGDRKTFWATNTDTNTNFQLQANLVSITDHAYLWIEQDLTYHASDARDLLDTFEQKIYPTDRSFFGSESTPGIDGDAHIFILYASGLGSHLAGYFSSVDSLPPQVHPYSNAHDMIFLNADNLSLTEAYTRSVLAHEFQHMIHWAHDANETAWVNEGFSELASYLNGYDPGGFDQIYAQDPDVQLTDWPGDPAEAPPHYGASFLFMDYFLNRFGPQATQSLAAEPANGMDGVDKVLSALNLRDSTSGQAITADDLFADWALATTLQDPSLADGRYAYANDPSAPRLQPVQTIDSCPTDQQNDQVDQYGVDLIRITCPGTWNLNLVGAQTVPLLAESSHSGSYAFWSNQGDESDTTLTRSFDLRRASGPPELHYWTWFDLEKDYDYLYLEASTDGGKSWQILRTPSCTTANPSGNSYGCGYNGQSAGWREETVDLSAFTGKEVTLRFQYITDAAVNNEGFLLDDVSLPAIGYSTDFETDNGGWQPSGFVRVQPQLPQTFRVSLVIEGKETSILKRSLSGREALGLSLDLQSGETALLLVSGTTRYTRQPATYQLRLTSAQP